MTTGNARRIGATMRALGFVPIKSRRLEPGGYRDTVTRGWTRPVRSFGYQVRPLKSDQIESTPLEIVDEDTHQPRENSNVQ